ncbi:MAG: hypothetical protein P8L22_03980 [Acidimicrobiales bacterium]|nr:hypothetical protein [Acidimicrobiales bacterium]
MRVFILNLSIFFHQRPIIQYVSAITVLIFCITSCSSSSKDKSIAEEPQVSEVDKLTVNEDDLAAAQAALVASEDDLAAAQAALSEVEKNLEAVTGDLETAKETIQSISRDLEQALEDLDDSYLSNQFLDEERRELRSALRSAIELGNSLDATKYPDCNPVHEKDRSLFGLATGTSMVEVITEVTKRCGPPNPFVPMFASDSTPDRDQWNSMCIVEDIWTRRVWHANSRTLTVDFYRTIDGNSENPDTGWMFGWSGGDLPGGIQIGMTRDQVIDVLDLDQSRFYQVDLYISADVAVDEAYVWGIGSGWGTTASTHGQPYNSSLLYFKDGTFVYFYSTEYSMCQ